MLWRMMHLIDVSEDSVNEWLAEAKGRSNEPCKHECPRCATVCEISGIQEYPTIRMKRFLGRGRSAADDV